MARPTKYCERRAKAICEALMKGTTRKAAAGAAGIDFQTFLNWLNRYSDFSTAVMEAEAFAENFCAEQLLKAASEDWRAAEAWLKRRRRDDWSEKIQQEIAGPDGGPLQVQEVRAMNVHEPKAVTSAD